MLLIPLPSYTVNSCFYYSFNASNDLNSHARVARTVQEKKKISERLMSNEPKSVEVTKDANFEVWK